MLLLLNLLIARFAKTFDVVYENLDANFKVAFAQVVLKVGGRELVPPPLNLLRELVLMLSETSPIFGRLDDVTVETHVA